jgi:hypothetical protein
MNRPVFLLVAALLLPALPAHAVQLGEEKAGQALPGASLKVNNTFYYKFNYFLDDDESDDVPAPALYHEFVNRVRADLQIKQFSVGAQVDIAGQALGCVTDDCGAQPILRGNGWPDDADPNGIVQLEKIWAKYQGKTVQIELGDFYASFGRGIVLALLKKPEIDQDNSIRGARFDLLTKPVDFTFLGGITNPSEVSMELRNTAIRTDPDSPGSLIVGGQFRVRPTTGWAIGLHGVGYDLLEDETKGTIGGTLEANGLINGGLDFYLEGNGLFYKKAVEQGGEIVLEDRTGHTIYGVATAYIDALTLTFEGKRFKDAQILRRDGPVTPLQYVLPPTLEHEASVTEDVNAAIQSNDVTGWRIRGDVWLLNSDTTLWASFSNSVDDTKVPDFNDEREIMIHPQIGIDQPIHIGEHAILHVNADIGYRHDFPVHNDDDTSNHLRNWGLLHVRGDVGFTIGDHAWELVSTYRRQHWTLASDTCWTLNGAEDCSADDGWIAMENALSYTYKGAYTVAVHLDFTDDNIVQNTQTNGAIGNVAYDKDWQASTYFGGEVILAPVQYLKISIFGGSQKAGIVCTGGACRNVPAFTGVKAKVDVNF